MRFAIPQTTPASPELATYLEHVAAVDWTDPVVEPYDGAVPLSEAAPEPGAAIPATKSTWWLESYAPRGPALAASRALSSQGTAVMALPFVEVHVLGRPTRVQRSSLLGMSSWIEWEEAATRLSISLTSARLYQVAKALREADVPPYSGHMAPYPENAFRGRTRKYRNIVLAHALAGVFPDRTPKKISRLDGVSRRTITYSHDNKDVSVHDCSVVLMVNQEGAQIIAAHPPHAPLHGLLRSLAFLIAHEGEEGPHGLLAAYLEGHPNTPPAGLNRAALDRLNLTAVLTPALRDFLTAHDPLVAAAIAAARDEQPASHPTDGSLPP
jgi:hypothetical protein